MAEKRKMGPKTTETKKKKQKKKIRQTDDHILGKRKMSTIGTRKKRKQNNGDYRDWAAGLPDHLLELVIERLALVDCLFFTGVCKPWRSMSTELFKGSSRVIPLLVKPRQSGKKTRTCLNVLDKTNRNPTFGISMRKKYTRSHIWGSYRDWLFLARVFKKHVHITLRNPFSGEKVVLPNTCNDYHMVVLSSVPSNPGCIYMLVHLDLGVAFWTSGAPREWRKFELMGSKRVVDALYHEGHFYLLNDMYEMVIIDEKSVFKSMINNNTDEDNYESSIVTQYFPLKVQCSDEARKYIVESNGEILLVSRIFHHEKTQGFETYKLDISQMAWVKLESLGNNNQVVFLGKSCSRSFNTKEIGGGGGDDALANKIYFSNNSYTNRINEWDDLLDIIPECFEADDWGVFSLNKERKDWPRAFREEAKHCAGIWVMAPIMWCFGQMLLKRR